MARARKDSSADVIKANNDVTPLLPFNGKYHLL